MKAPLTKDSSLSLFSHFIFQIYPKFHSNLMLSDSALLWSPPLYSRVVKYHFFCCFFCLFLVQPQMRKSKRNWAIFCPAGPKTPPTQTQAARRESWTGGPIFWRRWECSQHFPENAGVQTDRSWCEPVCHWPQVNYQESGRERRRLAQNWLHRHANPLALHSSWFSPDLESRRERFGV